MLNKCLENAFFKHFFMLPYIFVLILNPVIFVLSTFLNITGNSEGLGKIHSQNKILPIPLSIPQPPSDLHKSVYTLLINTMLKHLSVGMKRGLLGMHRAPMHTSTGMCLHAQGGVCTQHMLTCTRETPRGLVKGPQALLSWAGHVLYESGMMRC